MDGDLIVVASFLVMIFVGALPMLFIIISNKKRK